MTGAKGAGREGAVAAGRASTAPALALEGVTCTFVSRDDSAQRHTAVRDVTLRVAAGERCVLLGANGAGKTTLFNIILGDLMPSAGRILLFGSDVSRLAAHRRIRLGMRRTYQTSSTFAGLTVRECLFLAVRGVGGGRFALVTGATGGADMEAAAIAGRKVAVSVHWEFHS